MAAIKLYILKINGNDVSQLPANAMIEMFLKAQEQPFVIEVEQRKCPTATAAPDNTNATTTTKLKNVYLTLHNGESVGDKYTQTDDDHNHSNDLIHQMQTSQLTTDDIIEQEHNLFEQCLVAPEIDIEEITLRKSDSNEILGLTVCYSNSSNNSGIGTSGNALNNNNSNGVNNNTNSGGAAVASTFIAADDDNETCTEVYISDIHPNSIAERDGRLRQGDQILQINGKDVKTKEEIEALIAENNNAVTLLISRYLYADEDDFNDPSVACLNIQGNEEEEDDEDDDDDDDDDEFYNEENLPYENYIINQDLNVVNEFDKMLTEQQQQRSLTATLASAKLQKTLALKTNSLQSVTATSARITAKDNHGRKLQKPQAPHEKEKISHTNVPRVPAGLAQEPELTEGKSYQYEAEHIYETIPEDSESEPLYCSPYESSMYITAAGSCSSGAAESMLMQQQQQNKQRVAKWLGIRTTTAATLHSNCKQRPVIGGAASTLTNGSSSSSGAGAITGLNDISGVTVPFAQQVANKSEHDNSSSAYNTGGSNNSVPSSSIFPLALGGNTNEHRYNSKTSRAQSPKEQQQKIGIASPKHQVIKNLSSNELVQQYIRRQYLSQQEQTPQPQQHIARYIPQFTAPNLSRYRFVSGQEVSYQMNAIKIASMPNSTSSGVSSHPIDTKTGITEAGVTASTTTGEEQGMVWKVKRRQDGSRYIVRRPATAAAATTNSRQRIVRERSLRQQYNEREFNNTTTTTEDDTISEVKTGRYWSKEDRKKHIERARERRQQQQKNLCLAAGGHGASFMSTIRIGDHPASQLNKLQRQKFLVPYKSSANKTPTVEKHILDLYHPDQLQHCQLQFSSDKAVEAAAVSLSAPAPRSNGCAGGVGIGDSSNSGSAAVDDTSSNQFHPIMTV